MDFLPFLIVVPSCMFAFGLALCIAARREVEERRKRAWETFERERPDPRLWPEWENL